MSNLFLDSDQWAGPVSRLSRCSLLRCRVQVDNDPSSLDTPTEVPSEWNPTKPILRILSHKEWLEPTCTRRSAFVAYSSTSQIQEVVVHDASVTNFRCFTLSACIHYLRQISLDQLEEGSPGIGFNFMIGNDGTVYEGRGLNYEGSHTHGHNMHTYGIAFLGSYPLNFPAVTPLQAFWYLIKYLQFKKMLPDDFRLKTHRDLHPDDCPGLALQALMHTWSQGTPNPEESKIEICASEGKSPSTGSLSATTIGLFVLSSLVVLGLGLLVASIVVNYSISRSSPIGGTSSLIEHTPECQRWSEVCRRVNKSQLQFRHTDIHPNMPNSDQGRYRLFLNAYQLPAQVKLGLAFHQSLKPRGYNKELALITLFCQNWRSLLEQDSIPPLLLLMTLSALRRYIIVPNDIRPPLRIQLLTCYLDFMIVVAAHNDLNYNDQMAELCSDTSVITSVRRERSTWNPFCGRSFRLSCLKCDLCQPLETQENYTWTSGHKGRRSGRKRFTLGRKSTEPRMNTYYVGNTEWHKFRERQNLYARIPELEDEETSFQKFLVYRESSLDGT
ncbi:unnamed protein product [Echinostoma caproni]|uniref:PGRP domain-containing protein n=1 Tax=Echinostoma caproni TaxID=27848 RepID=A0A183AUA4_9TREM|nr:unnamed protein product [Echinostoma caproni]